LRGEKGKETEGEKRSDIQNCSTHEGDRKVTFEEMTVEERVCKGGVLNFTN